MPDEQTMPVIRSLTSDHDLEVRLVFDPSARAEDGNYVSPSQTRSFVHGRRLSSSLMRKKETGSTFAVLPIVDHTLAITRVSIPLDRSRSGCQRTRPISQVRLGPKKNVSSDAAQAVRVDVGPSRAKRDVCPLHTEFATGFLRDQEPDGLVGDERHHPGSSLQVCLLQHLVIQRIAEDRVETRELRRRHLTAVRIYEHNLLAG